MTSSTGRSRLIISALPYLTAYQLAIELDARHPEVARVLGYQIGGAGTSEDGSLAQYIARELSARIRDNTLPEVEGAFLSGAYVKRMLFQGPGQEVESSRLGIDGDLSMFRLRRQ